VVLAALVLVLGVVGVLWGTLGFGATAPTPVP
jgi:hypothetical protein